jgi:hypothetical protein
MAEKSYISKRWVRAGAGAMGALITTGVCALAMALPLASPGITPPVARLLNVVVTESGRGAYIAAMQQDGYELTAPMKITAYEELSAQP